MKNKKVLIAGESWMSFTTHVKGFDTFYTSVYEEGIKWLRAALEEGGYDVTFIPNHLAAEEFPFKLEELQKFNAVILSDIGANTLLLSKRTFIEGQRTPNRLKLIEEYVANGGGFCMVGGYLSFTGIDAKANFKSTAIAEILPVDMLDKDDRIEACEGILPVIKTEHEIFNGLPTEWPHFLGYNQTTQNAEGEVLATIGDDPFVAVREYQKGRTAVFTSDCSPHWAPKEFVEWSFYNKFWINLVNWIAKA
ncbi:MAG: glutamine amidotransferase [Vallitalea sp.]|jgi:uncharacterized membrane protein|nr:glutamine amidotransferase [Vallitalea sp.]